MKKLANANIKEHRYVSADYERRKFSVSQCSWTPGVEQKIVAIPSINNNGSDSNTTTTSSKKTSTGAIAGGVVGGIAGLALISTAGYFIFTKLIRAELDNDGERPPELESKSNAHEIGGQQHVGYEVEGKRLTGHELGGDYKPEYELGGDRKPGHELDAGPNAAEMSAREAPAAELP